MVSSSTRREGTPRDKTRGVTVALLFIFTGLGAGPAPGLAAGPVWPGVYGHGTDWRLNDAPGSGTPQLYIINSLSDGPAAGAAVPNYNNTGQTSFVGNFRYALESANTDASGAPSGKVILLAINGTLNNNQAPWIWYLESCDWTVMDLNPPGIDDGLFLRNIKLGTFSPGGDDRLDHLLIKDLRMFHGAGANGVDGAALHLGQLAAAGGAGGLKGAIVRIKLGNGPLVDHDPQVRDGRGRLLRRWSFTAASTSYNGCR